MRPARLTEEYKVDRLVYTLIGGRYVSSLDGVSSQISHLKQNSVKGYPFQTARHLDSQSAMCISIQVLVHSVNHRIIYSSHSTEQPLPDYTNPSTNNLFYPTMPAGQVIFSNSGSMLSFQMPTILLPGPAVIIVSPFFHFCTTSSTNSPTSIV